MLRMGQAGNHESSVFLYKNKATDIALSKDYRIMDYLNILYDIIIKSFIYIYICHLHQSGSYDSISVR